MKKFAALIVILAVLVLGYFVWQNQKTATPPDSNNISVVASFYPLAYFAEQIGGDKVQVTNITPAGSEPHDYEPTANQIVAINNSKLLILNGGNLENWGSKVQANLGPNVKVVVAGQEIINQTVNEDGNEIVDPHVWLSPPLAKREAQSILDGLIAVDPNNTKTYQNNANQLFTELDDLDAKYRQGLSQCQQTEFITSHAAFGYLAHTYNIIQVPITGISPEEEPSSQQLVSLAELIKQKNITVVFFESLVSPKLSQTLAQETGAQSLVLDPIEGVSKDELQAGKNYATIMTSNLDNLKIALQCQ